MILVCFPFLAALLYHCYSCNSLNIRPDENVEKEDLNEKIHLTDLNADCLYLIFNELDLNDLLSMVQTNTEFAQIASAVYRQKYSDYEVRIERIRSEKNKKPLYISKTEISIRDFNMVSNIMKYFGNNIRKMAIWNYSDHNTENKWAMINRMVNEYGSESLIQLKYGYVSKELWPQFTVPFKTVETLCIEIAADTDGKKLNQLFSNVKVLKIHLMTEANYEFIDCALPHLEHLDMFFSSGDFSMTKIWNRKESIIGLIKKNPQIRSVDAAHTTPEFNKLISEHLPELEKLKFTYGPNDGPLHFENVKDLVLYRRYQSSLAGLSLPRLELFETSLFTGELEIFTEFFQRHENLRRLIFQRIWCKTHHLSQLMTHSPNVVEVIVKYEASSFTTEDVANFMERHPKLMTFQFPVRMIAEADLRKKFESNWHIKSFAIFNDAEYYKVDVLLFKRKIES